LKEISDGDIYSQGIAVVIEVVSVVLLIFIIFYSYKCVNSFGKGLKEKLIEKKSVYDSE
jgi:hypothetical protein